MFTAYSLIEKLIMLNPKVLVWDLSSLPQLSQCASDEYMHRRYFLAFLGQKSFKVRVYNGHYKKEIREHTQKA